MRIFLFVAVILMSPARIIAESSAWPRPIRPEVAWVDCSFGQVWAFYTFARPKPSGEIGWNEQITSDSATKAKMLHSHLSPGRDRYFHVEILPEFADRFAVLSPNYDDWPEPVANSRALAVDMPWDKNPLAMRVRVFRLSGEEVTTIDLPRSYAGCYAQGLWLDDRWICLHERHGLIGGNRYSLFVDTKSGQKRVVGLEVNDERAAGNGRFIVFSHGGMLYVNFRPVFPVLGEPLPDFGDENGWRQYKEQYFIRQEKRPWETTQPPYLAQYDLVPQSNKVLVLMRTPPPEQRPLRADEEMARIPDLAGPQLVLVELNNVEAAKDTKEYAKVIATLPKAVQPYLLRDEKTGEFSVDGYQSERLWHKSFAELAAP